MRPLAQGLAVALVVTVGCARPYSTPKTVAAVATGVLLGGGALWVAGERTGRGALVAPGFAATVLGAGALIGAGGWLAASIACRADPDCPAGEWCKEVPAPPGATPYRQCVRR